VTLATIWAAVRLRRAAAGMKARAAAPSSRRIARDEIRALEEGRRLWRRPTDEEGEWFQGDYSKAAAYMCQKVIGWINRIRQQAGGEEKARPNDLITMRVAVKKFYVSASTLKRAVKVGTIKSHRAPDALPNATHEFSEAELAARYERKD
jgi:hypothetical protein